MTLFVQLDTLEPNVIVVGELIARLEDLGREDAVHVLLGGCSLYRILTVEESMSPNSNSEQQQQQLNTNQEATLDEESVS